MGKPVTPLTPVVWVGSSLSDLKELPDEVQDDIGHALYDAQLGGKSNLSKPLRGFGGAGVLEIVEDHAGDTFRAVYTVRFRARIYVLHVFQKKSKRGSETPKSELDLVRRRLKWAEELHEEWLASGKRSA